MKQILSLAARAACALLFTAATACSASDGPSDPDSLGESADELSVTRPSFVTLRADLRPCTALMCGGYFVRDVNRHAAEWYVSGLDLSASRLPTDVIADVRSAPANELVLYGHLGLEDPRLHTRPFVVLDAFRGMPGITPREDAAFYLVHARKPPIDCFAAPCPNETASLLNTSREEEFDRVSVDGEASPWVDERWLASRVETHDAIAAGALAQGEHFPGGFEEVLEASQVFVHLPDRIGPCPARPTVLCPEGTIAVHERTEDRCIVQVGCERPAMCQMFLPVCQDGYTLVSWTAPLGGCKAFACDPSFVVR
jgi:hypothetical protein